MDIPMISIVLSQSQLQHQASISVIKKAIGNEEQLGNAVRDLIISSNVSQPTPFSHPHLGKSIDVKL